MKLTRDLYTLQSGDRYLLYAPIDGEIIIGNRALVDYIESVRAGNAPESNPQMLEELTSRGIFKPDDFSFECESVQEENYSPTSVLLLPTYNCNLRCTYCYSEAGTRLTRDMDGAVARAAVDFIINNSLSDKRGSAVLGFHGGGEPLLKRNNLLIRETISYFREQTTKHSLKSKVHCITNGLIEDANPAEIIPYFDTINISLDGYEDIQNRQRPRRDGSDSFGHVRRTIEYLDSIGFDYGFRTTITNESVSHMKDIARYFHENFHPRSMHFEPLFECGRCKTTKAASPDSLVFLENLIETADYCWKNRLPLLYSGGNIARISTRFCGASGRNFFITPNGEVTTCLEVCRPDHDLASTYFVGKYDFNEGRFIFDNEKINHLRQRKVQNIPNCQNCFAKFNCSGDCSLKVQSQTGNPLDTQGNCRCNISRGWLAHQLWNVRELSRVNSLKGGN